MARERAIQIRVFQTEYDLIKANADAAQMDLSSYVRAVAISPLSVGQMDASSPPADSLAKPENRAKATEQVEHLIRTDSRETAEASLQPLITQLKGQGMTTPVATREARKRLGL